MRTHPLTRLTAVTIMSLAIGGVSVQEVSADAPKTPKVDQGSSGKSSKPAVLEVRDEAHLDEQLRRTMGPMLVDFYAEWCGPCRVQAKMLNELATEVRHAKLLKIDIDKHPQLAKKFGVKAIPTLIVFRHGKPVDRKIGVTTKERLKVWLEK